MFKQEQSRRSLRRLQTNQFAQFEPIISRPQPLRGVQLLLLSPSEVVNVSTVRELTGSPRSEVSVMGDGGVTVLGVCGGLQDGGRNVHNSNTQPAVRHRLRFGFWSGQGGPNRTGSVRVADPHV